MNHDISCLLDTKSNITTAKIKNNGRWLKDNNPILLENILSFTSFLPKDVTFSRRVFHFANRLESIPLCIVCLEKPTSFTTFNRGYKKYCSDCGPKVVGDVDTMKASKIETKKNYMDEINQYLQSPRSEGISSLESLKSMDFSDNCTFIFKDKNILFGILFHSMGILPTPRIIENVQELNLPERIFLLQSGMDKRPVCEVCGMDARFVNRNKGYSKTCMDYKCKFVQQGITRKQGVKKKLEGGLVEQSLILPGDYNGHCFPTKLKCEKCGMKFDFIFRSGSSFRDNLCPGCYPRGVQSELEEFINIGLGFDIMRNTRTIISPVEIDIFIPERKIAIEFNGLHWHSETIGGKGPSYHLGKLKECEKRGIRLFHIFEDEWKYKKNIVKSVISAKLGIFQEKIMARKCEVVELSSTDKDIFLEENHLQGRDISLIRLGLRYQGNIVSVMTFGSRKITGGQPTFELIRFANKRDCLVIGGASKLFSYFLEKYKQGPVVSYADRRWSVGDLYVKLGFDFDHISSPNYWYIKGGKRFHRVNWQKHKLKDKLEIFSEEDTEYQNMLNNGYDRVWDCGNMVFIHG